MTKTVVTSVIISAIATFILTVLVGNEYMKTERIKIYSAAIEQKSDSTIANSDTVVTINDCDAVRKKMYWYHREYTKNRNLLLQTEEKYGTLKKNYVKLEAEYTDMKKVFIRNMRIKVDSTNY